MRIDVAYWLVKLHSVRGNIIKTLLTITLVASATFYFGSEAKAAMDTVELQKQHNAQIEQLLSGKGYLSCSILI